MIQPLKALRIRDRLDLNKNNLPLSISNLFNYEVRSCTEERHLRTDFEGFFHLNVEFDLRIAIINDRRCLKELLEGLSDSFMVLKDRSTMDLRHLKTS